MIRRGLGSHVWDVDGNEYIDYLIGSGPMLVGHCHPQVKARVEAQLELGTTFFANNEHCIELAEEIVNAVPCAEQVRYVSAGGEATMYAMRLARAHRRRDLILKFEGGYHGMNDYALQSMAPKQLANFPQAVPDSAGIPSKVADEMLIAPFNDTDAAVAMIREHADDLAAVIVEPFQRIIPPLPGFLEALREVTEELGIILIFDEVVTGFRLSYAGAQGYYGITPDLCSLGKIIGGGFPLAAIAGKESIMRHFDASAVEPQDFALQIRTLSGNPVASVAGLETMKILREPGAYDKMFATGRAIMDGIKSSLDNVGVAAQIVGLEPLFDVVFTEPPVNNYREFLSGNSAKAATFNKTLREHGIFKSDSKFYIALAHTEEDVRATLDAVDHAAKAVAAMG